MQFVEIPTKKTSEKSAIVASIWSVPEILTAHPRALVHDIGHAMQMQAM